MISCLCPTFNRYPEKGHLLSETVECFLRQDYDDKELVILNDCPQQKLVCDLPGVRVINLKERLPSMSAKFTRLIEEARGEMMCRWDDDDLSLPWRLSKSREKLGDKLEWRPENYWFHDVSQAKNIVEVKHPGNTHNMAIFTKRAVEKIGGFPPNLSGPEDQHFNAALVKAGFPVRGDLLDVEDIFYIYRWGVSPHHLSGVGGTPANMQAHYDRIGKKKIVEGTFTIKPHWRHDYLKMREQALEGIRHMKHGHPPTFGF